MKKSLSLLLALLCLFPASLIGCSQTRSGGEPVTTAPPALTTASPSDTASAAPAQTEPAEITRENYPDTLPAGLRFDGETFTMLIRSDSNRVIEFKSEGLTGEVVNDANITREQKVEERLGIEIEWLERAQSATATYIRSSLNANTIEFDLIAGDTSYMIPLSTEGHFTNWIDTPYIDFTMPWWNADANMVDSLSLFGKLYCITGDLSRLFVQKHGVTYFNQDLMAEHPEIPNLYELVLEGKWTLDRLSEYSALVKEDLNGDTVMDINDRYGLATYFATPFDNFILALGQSVAVKDEEGMPKMTLDTEEMHNLCTLLTDLTQSDTTFIHPGSKSGTITFFNESHALFVIGGFEWATDMRSMDSNFGIIPYPKLNEQQEGYYTGYSDVGTSLFAIPAATSRLDFACAVTEALAAESYRTVTTAYFETALKEKYARDSQTSQMLDIVRAGIIFDFGFFYSAQLHNCSTLMRSVVQQGKNNYASQVASFTRLYERQLAKLIDSYSD